VVAVNEALCCPEAIVTLAGTAAVEGSDELSETTAPAGGARPFRRTYTVTFEPPPTDADGENVSEANAARFTVNTAVFVTPL